MNSHKLTSLVHPKTKWLDQRPAPSQYLHVFADHPRYLELPGNDLQTDALPKNYRCDGIYQGDKRVFSCSGAAYTHCEDSVRSANISKFSRGKVHMRKRATSLSVACTYCQVLSS